MFVGIIVLVVLLVMFGAFFIGAQRTLVTLDENVNNSLAQIEVNLSSRFDALTGLLDLVKGYNEHEANTLKDVIAMRATGHTTKEIQENENIITQAMGKIVATAEAYPDLKSNTNYQNLMNSLNDYENKVRSTRLVANDSITKLNRMVRSFPYMFVAPILGINSREYLKTDEAKKEMPSMK